MIHHLLQFLFIYGLYFVIDFGVFALIIWREIRHPKNKPYDGPYPPRHPNCRCIVAPMLDDDRPQTLPDKTGYLNRW